jgi:hypothetical protein
MSCRHAVSVSVLAALSQNLFRRVAVHLRTKTC